MPRASSVSRIVLPAALFLLMPTHHSSGVLLVRSSRWLGSAPWSSSSSTAPWVPSSIALHSAFCVARALLCSSISRVFPSRVARVVVRADGDLAPVVVGLQLVDSLYSLQEQPHAAG